MSKILEAVRSKDLAVVLKAIEGGADVNEKSAENGQTPLSLACEAGHLEVVKLLLDAGADPNLPGEQGDSPLMCAAASFMISNAALELCQLLITYGADIEAINEAGETAIEFLLYAAGDKPNEDIAAFLIEEMLKKAPGRDISKIAHLVVDYGHRPTLELLLQNGLDIESKDRFGYSLLHSACRGRLLDKVDLLLKSGADFNFQPKLGWNDHPFALACRFSRIDWFEFLKKNGFQFEQNPELLQTAINSAVEKGQWEALTYLEREGIVLGAKHGKQESALFTAIEFNQGDVITHLLERGADLSERDAQGNTVLHHAGYYGNLEILKALHTAGAEVNALNDLGWNALMQASVGGNPAITEYLIAAGIDLDQRCKETGATALIIAATEGHGKIVEALLNAGADAHIHSKDGKTAATAAFAGGHTGLVQAMGGIRPHFIAYASTNGKTVCAYCAEVLTEEMLQHNHCPECDAFYCDTHYPWSKWRRSDPTSVYPSREVACPNGHRKSEDLEA